MKGEIDIGLYSRGYSTILNEEYAKEIKPKLYTQKGMESIRKANESATTVAASNGELVMQIQEIDRMAEEIRERSGVVAKAMEKISENTQQNCSAVEQISAATQENCAGMSSLSGFVEQIRENTEQLNALVQE